MQHANDGRKKWLRLPAHRRPINVTIPVTVPIDVRPSDVPIIAKADQPESMVRATERMARTSVAMLFVAIATFAAACLQWKAMDDQIAQMKADHASVKVQSEAVLDQMKADNAIMKDQIKLTQDQITHAEKQLKQNEVVLDQMRLEQRAWVGVQKPRFMGPEIGEPLQWSMYLSNSGQTPALVERIEYNMARRPQEVAFDPGTVRLIATVDLQQSLAPDATARVPFTSTNNLIDEALLDFIKNVHAPERIYIFGRVHYEDVAGVKRETEFAFVNDPGSDELRLHHKHNRMR